MEIRNLESFVQAAELGSFTRAAQKLGYTQSSVSAQIKQLETELGIQLFERVNHTVRLTTNGREILSLAHTLLRTAADMKRTANNPGELTGCVRIAIAPSLCHWLFEHDFQRFFRQFPGISLKIIASSTEEMFRLLNQNEVDLVYTLDHHIYDRNYVIALEVPVTSHFVAARSHPLAVRFLQSAQTAPISVQNLSEWPFILTEEGMSYRRLLDEYLASRSISVSPILELGDTSLICMALKSGVGVSYLPDYVTEEDVCQGALVRFPTPELKLDIWKQLLYHKNKWVSEEMRAVIQFLGQPEFL